MEFNKAYNREEYLSFLRVNFLPDDFQQEISSVENPIHFQYTQQVTRLGECESLGLVVYEVRHNSKHDARVGLTKEAFRLLADEFCERALVFFVPKDDNNNYRFSLIEITLDQSEKSSRVSRRYSNPHRYSYYLGKGIAYYTPNKYLNEYGRVVSVEDLRNRFSVDVLTKAFYQELSDWYAWAIMVVRFPNDMKTLEDNQKYNSEAMIRLITRLIFVWFLKQRHLVPDEFFDEQFIADELIQGFTPHAETTLFGKAYDSKYYKGVLQNLFFAMLNSPITPEGKDTISERRFRNGRGDYDNNKLMRHEDLFINPAKFVELANKYVPFLNGGLFDCLDDKDKGIYIDAFTDRKAISDQLVIPDFLFFGDEVGKNIDLSEWYGDKKKKKVSARGIIDILKRYNFTVEENTPFDQEVSLDPELLGKVFENLLAAYNPETQTTARKQTGSFYTPREIVQYMVDESLIAHLKRTVGEDLEPEYRKLVQYTDEELNLNDDQKRQIMQSLYECKVLDPACGSGAFPMGMLQQMVHILNRIDPNNEQWKEMMLNNAISETSEAYHNATDEERAEIVADIERSFNESINRPDYARKLYLIENCIYGVDIQPIAIQISKLRFFISLVVDQKTNNNPIDNFGIRPLPNLEAKFVAANTLIDLERRDADLFDSDAIKQKEKEMKDAKHRIFGAKTVKTKRKYKDKVAELRTEIAKLLEESGAVGNIEARQLSEWDMFDQNTSSPFFDSEWMFGVSNGFDVVMGNPPYVSYYSRQAIPLSDEKRLFFLRHFDVVPNIRARYNSFHLFIEKSLKLSIKYGIVFLIVDRTLLVEKNAILLRKYILEKSTIVELAPYLSNVFSAIVDPLIIHLKNNKDNNYSIRILQSSNLNACVYKELNIRDVNKESGCEIKVDKVDCSLNFERIFNGCSPLKCVAILKSGANIGGHSEEFIFEKPINNDCKPVLKGSKNVSKYYLNKNKISYLLYDHKLQEYINKKEEAKINGKKNLVKLGDGHIDHRFEKEKLIIRQSSSTFVAAYDNMKYYCMYGLFVLNQLDHNVNLKYILALLNSKLYSYYGFVNHIILTGDKKQPQIRAKGLKELPIKIASKNEQDIIIRIVDSIINAKETDINTDTSNLETKVDFLVYHLYGLTYDEVLIVDPETPITREEYETE
jgi:hypothetical protein